MTYMTIINATFAKFVLNDLTFCGNLMRARTDVRKCTWLQLSIHCCNIAWSMGNRTIR